MLVMFEVTNPVERAHTMTKRQVKSEASELKAILSSDDDFLRTAVRAAIQSALEAEMTEALAAERSERVDGRLGYRSGFYSRSLITRVGTIELRVPRDRAGRFSTELFERYQRSERALVSALAEMYVQGVSTRKVKAVSRAHADCRSLRMDCNSGGGVWSAALATCCHIADSCSAVGRLRVLFKPASGNVMFPSRHDQAGKSVCSMFIRAIA